MARPVEPRSPGAAVGERIAKLLARAGIASRREVERMIDEGRVAINGVAMTTPATVLTSLDGVTVDGQPVGAAEPARLFLYHKPVGLLVTERDPGGRPTIYDRLPRDLPRVVPVGRLDLNTEGLLLLTTDGGLKRQLELPATGVERTYRARAYGQVTQAQLEDLIEGVEIEGVRYGGIDANLERRTGANVWIELTLTEGKNREVRRVLEHLGLRVGRLIRTRYGPFLLADLPPGQVGEVRAHDIESFRANPTRSDLPQPRRREAGHDPEVRKPRPVTARGERPVSGGVAASTRHSGERRDPATVRANQRVTAGVAQPARIASPGLGLRRGGGEAQAAERAERARGERTPRSTTPSRMGRAPAPSFHHGEGRGPATVRADQRITSGDTQRARDPRAPGASRLPPSLDGRGKRPAATNRGKNEGESASASPRPAKPQRKTGWAKPKPKGGPAKPRKPRA